MSGTTTTCMRVWTLLLLQILSGFVNLLVAIASNANPSGLLIDHSSDASSSPLNSTPFFPSPIYFLFLSFTSLSLKLQASRTTRCFIYADLLCDPLHFLPHLMPRAITFIP
ncbi:hypothetical protein EDB83DRAFT_1760527 [Lactarius deliciosus]|nr:hypothetical protein EDB83DRAFT_1760527 [Lactarius deliciosus]